MANFPTPPNQPAVLSPLVPLNSPMVGFASPFDHADGQNRDLILEAIRTWASVNLLTWSGSWQTFFTAWIASVDAYISANAIQGIQGIPGPNSIPTDTFIGTQVNMVGSATQIALDTRYGLGVNVKAFGAKGDGTTDDTIAIQNAINYAQTLVVNIPDVPQGTGATVYIPRGRYLISASLRVNTGNITIEGESSSASVITAPNANFNLIVFDNTTVALYNCGIKNLRITTPGNATAGYHLTVKHCIYFIVENMLFNGWYGGMYMAACGKMMTSKVIFSQEVRTDTTTLTGAAIYMASDYMYSSDIHFTDIQIMENSAYAGLYSFILTGVDGLYIENSHMHGSFLITPGGIGNETVVSSLVFSNTYFDGSRDACVILGGSAPAAYKDIRFSNCYFRGGLTGLRLNSATTMSLVTISDSVFAQNTQNGLEINNHNVNGLIVDGCTFYSNNAGNSVNYGDVYLNGNAVQMSDCSFSGGGVTGFGISIPTAASYMALSNLNFINSTAGTKIANAGPYTAFKGIIGWVVKTTGNAPVGAGTTSFAVAHGMNVTPTLASITLTPGGATPAYWVSGITATQFTINFASATAAAVNIGYLIDMEY